MSTFMGSLRTHQRSGSLKDSPSHPICKVSGLDKHLHLQPWLGSYSRPISCPIAKGSQMKLKFAAKPGSKGEFAPISVFSPLRLFLYLLFVIFSLEVGIM